MKNIWSGVTTPAQVASLLEHVLRNSGTEEAGQPLADWARVLLEHLSTFGLAIGSKKLANSFIDLAKSGDVDEGTFCTNWHLSQFFKKFRYGCEMSVGDAHSGFLSRNAACTCTPAPLIRLRMRELLSRALPFVGELEGRFGPGVTLDSDATFESKLSYVASFHGSGRRIYEPRDLDFVSRGAKLVAVPKDMCKLRTITVEPLACQWQQQAARSRLLASIHRGCLRGTVMDLGISPSVDVNGVAIWRTNDSAAKQRIRCSHAACTGRLATLDLSDASDSISWDAVKGVFPSWVMSAIEPVRSEYVVSSTLRQRAQLRMYAGMGNATTFPIETLYFWALFTATAEELHRGNPSVSVFGDDIVMRQELASHPWFLHTLAIAGVKVNQDKSGLSAGPGFREACGLVAYKSQVVPATFRFYGYAASREGAIGYCDLVSRLLASPLPAMNLLGWLLMSWEGAPSAPFLPLGDEYTSSLAYRVPERLPHMPSFVCPHPAYVVSRYNSNLQRIEVRLPTMRAKRARFTIRDPSWGPGVSRSWGWWAYKLSILGKQTLDARILPKAREVTYAIPHRTQVRRSWVPCRSMFACTVR